MSQPRLSCWKLISVLTLAASCVTPTHAQTAYFAIEGELYNVGDTADCYFDLSRSVDSSEKLMIQTLGYNGGTSASGDEVDPKYFRPRIKLFNSSASLRGQNDSSLTADKEAIISWPSIQTTGTPLNPSPLPADTYKLSIDEVVNHNYTTWVLDILGPADAITLTGIDLDTTMVNTIKIGTIGAGSDVAAMSITDYLELEASLSIGHTGNCVLDITDGGEIFVDTHKNILIGYNEAAVGVINVSGADSQMTTEEGLYVGAQGQGTLNVLDGGSVRSKTLFLGIGDADSYVNVSGPNASMQVQYAAHIGGMYADVPTTTATMTIENGATLITSQVSIGYHAQSTDKLIVTGSGTTWNGYDTYLGIDGPGELRIENGAQADGRNISIGRFFTDASGSVNLSGQQTLVSLTDSLYLGGKSDAQVIIEAGATLTSNAGYITHGSESNSTVRVVGEGSNWEMNNLYMEPDETETSGSSTMFILDGATVSAARGYIGSKEDSFAYVSVARNNSTLSFTGRLNIAGGRTIYEEPGGAGVLVVSDSGQVIADDVVTLWIDGQIMGNGSITTPLLKNGGEVATGLAYGNLTFTINGDYTQQADGTLWAFLKGTDYETGYSSLIVNGTATLDGTLIIGLSGSFVPSAGDHFEVLTADTIVGNFASIELPTLPDNLEWDTSRLPVDGSLSVTFSALVADLNGNGFVGLDDLDIVLSHWNQNVSIGDPLAGDPTGDGYVGLDDLDVILKHWNATIPPAADQKSVPEPTSIGLLLFSAIAIAQRRHRVLCQ